MSLTVKRPTIEGMPSPAVRNANAQDGAAAPAMRLDVMRSVRKHPRLAAGVGGAVFLLAFLFGLLRKPSYLAESLIYIEPLASKVLSDGTSGSYDAGRYDSYFQQQTQTALRPDILASAIEKLPPFVWQRGGESMQSAVTRLQNSLKVQRVLTSYQLSISLVYANPQAAAAVVNAVTNSYLEQGRKDEHAVIDQRLKLLGEERQRIQQQLGEDRVEQASLGGLLGMADSSGKTVSPFDAQIAGVQTQVAGAREARDVAAAQYAAVQTGSPALTAAAEEQIATDAGLNSMKQTISQRKALLSTQMAGLTPSNPIYKQDQDEIADLDRSLDAMTLQIREKAARRLQDKLRSDLQRTADIEGRLNAELRHQTATATSSVPKLQRAQDLAADIQRLTARYTVVDDAMRSLELESNGPGSAHLSVPATVPVSPEPSKRKLILALSLPLACFAGLFAAVFANRMDPRIYSAPDVEQVLGFSPIGVLPARSEVTGRTMEEYTLRLAAGLQSAYRSSSAQSFVFTAASATMQTSEFVQAIARILGTLGFKALVMDASSVLNAANKTSGPSVRGATSYRAGALARTIEGTRLEVGRQGFAAEELDRLKSKYDLLLIDAPPLLTSAETEYLVRCADATILVAESGTTVKTELYQSALLLQHLNVAGVGAVLQELHLKDAEPSFRAAIEAVERLQRSRTDRHEQAESLPANLGHEEEEVDTKVAELEPLPETHDAVVNQAVTLPAETKPVVQARAPESDSVAAAEEEAAPAVEEAVHVVEQDSVEGPDQVRPWKNFLKRTSEPEPELKPEPVVLPVTPRKEESRAGSDEEPVIYFQDRLRPRKPAEPAATAAQEERGYESALAATEALRNPAEFEAVTHSLESRPVTSWGEMDAPAPVSAQAFENHPTAGRAPAYEHTAAQPETVAEDDAYGYASERTVTEAGAEGDGRLAPEPEVEELTAAVPVAESAAEPESVMEADTEPVGALGETGAVMEASEEVNVNPPLISEPAEKAASVRHADDSKPTIRNVIKREPTPPKMGWFTLKFRGTSERVLRIIPSEDEDEYEAEVEEPVALAGDAAREGMEDLADGDGVAPTVEEPVPLEDASTTHEAEIDTRMVSVPEFPTLQDEEVASVIPTRQSEEERSPVADVETEAAEANREFEVEDEASVSSAAGEEYVEPQGRQQIDDEGYEDHALEALTADDTAMSEEVFPVDSAEEVERSPEVEEPVMPVAASETQEGEPKASEEQAPEPAAVEAHTPVKLRWTVRDLDGDEFERELNGDHAPSASAGVQPQPAGAMLMSELRSRAAAVPTQEESAVQKHSSGRRLGAPVEERLEPRASSLTRRWEMLSRFDAPSATREADAPEAGS